MNRGSEWRKWDLHIHTPNTAKNDQYGNSPEVWEKYITALEQTDVAVFGITDYFSMENYFRIKEFQEKGRLQGKTILPNVEMRITPVTKTGTAINIHAIFDPSLTKKELEREFFSNLTMKSGDNTYSCTRQQLVDFGRKLANDNLYPEDASIKKAIGEFIIPFEELYKIFEKKFFDNRVIIALSGKSQDGLSGLLNTDCNTHTLRLQIGRMADIILSSNSKDIAYFLGEGVDSKEKVIETYRSLKPCIIGSDAHSLDKIGVFPNERITWVKADPTFEGFKQILFEPKERVRISDTMPDLKYDYNIIDHVVINTAGTWNQTIPLNANLNTIIGGRSTGKSTLLSSIASKFKDLKDIDNYSFVKRLSENVHVIWRDAQEENNKEIEYFSQNEIANLIDKGDSDKLFSDILTGKSQLREEFELFKSKEATLFSSIQAKVASFFEKRRQYFEKFSYVKQLGDREGISREIAKLESERNNIQLKLTDKKDLIDKYQSIEKEISQLKIEEVKANKELEYLNKLSKSEFYILNSSLSYDNLSEQVCSKISEEVKRVLLHSNAELQSFIKSLTIEIDSLHKNIVNKINNLQEDRLYKEGKQIFDENKNLLNIVTQINNLSKLLVLIDNEAHICAKIKQEYNNLANELLNDHLAYVDMMNYIASILRIQHDNITLSASFELKPSLESNLEESISLRSAAMNELIIQIVNQFNTKSKEEIKNCLWNILNKSLKNEIPLKNGYNTQTFISNVFSSNWFELKYNVDYESDSLLDMSPGKRSFVVLKLLLDFSEKKCPILIDQPEDNLDNRAIYNDLVKYIREKKKDRQIILVTHNPNIVVGADSEEVIVANQNGKNAPNSNGIKFQYVYGSLEDTFPRKDDFSIPILFRCGIREHVCDILEGGENAFRDRENKYGFFKV